MPQHGPLYGEEQARAIDLARRLLTPDLHNHGSGPANFSDPTWRWVPLPGMLWDNSDRDFMETLMGCGGFPVSESAPRLATYLDPLTACLRKRGVDSVILRPGWYPSEALEPVEAPEIREFTVKPDPETICTSINLAASGRNPVTEERCSDGWGVQDAVMFDWSGEWLAFDEYNTHTILGGTPDFIEQYSEACGGEDMVRAWFYHYVVVYGPDRYEGPDGRMLCEWAEELYRALGWPEPLYKSNGTQGKSGYDLDWSPMFGDRVKSAGPGID